MAIQQRSTPVMMNRSFMFALLLLVGTSAALQGQQTTGDRSNDTPGPISMLLSIQDQIALTEAQVGQLLKIERRWDSQNQPLVARLVTIRGRIRELGERDAMTAEQRALYESYVAEARPLMRDIAENNRAAMEDVGDVLTETQKETIGRLLKKRENRDRSGSSSQSGDRGN